MAHVEHTIPHHGQVLDIGGSRMSALIIERLRKALYTTPKGEIVTLPDELLYDDVGLHIWAEIIFTPEFYQTRDEIALFEENSAKIAKYISKEAVMIDIGAGDLRKVECLLSELEKRGDHTTYLALDISRASLEANLGMLEPKHENITCAGLWGDFGGGLSWVKQIDPHRPRVILSLGSVLFNDAWDTAVANLKSWAQLLRPQDRILAGMDGHTIGKHRDKIWAAYHTHDDLFANFWANGFAHANKLLESEVLCPEDWETCAELDEPEGRHRFFFRAKRDIDLGRGVVAKAGQVMEWFDAHKHDEDDVRKMCEEAGLAILEVWRIPGSEMCQYLLKLREGRESSPDSVDSAISGMQ